MKPEDIRWHKVGGDCERLTYAETLRSQLNLKNNLITKAKWAQIEAMLPTITEEEAEKTCFWIRDEKRAKIRNCLHQQISGAD